MPDIALTAHSEHANLIARSYADLTVGICIIDEQLRLASWNKRYQRLLQLPDELLTVGASIENILNYNAARGLLGEGSQTVLVQRRIDKLRGESAYRHIRKHGDGSIIEIVGTPLAEGGYVTSYYDVSRCRAAEITMRRDLERMKAEHEEQSMQLHELHAQLRADADNSDQASHSKTRFLAGVSHDLLQPLNAARLFTATLAQRLDDSKALILTRNVENALRSAEQMLSTLMEMSRLDTGKMVAKPTHFNVNKVFQVLAEEFRVVAEDRGLQFDFVNSDTVVYTDPQLLRRVLQNFLSNAMRYTAKRKLHGSSSSSNGRVLLGARRRGTELELQVWDNGPGIPNNKLKKIFNEFQRLQTADQQGVKGFGLGLTIVDRISKLLQHPVNVRSWPNRGSVFSVRLPLGDTAQLPNTDIEDADKIPATTRMLDGLSVLCVDNEVKILEAMQELIRPWGCRVYIAYNLDDAARMLPTTKRAPDIILADYKLENGETGLDVVNSLYERWNARPPCVVITGEKSKDVVDSIANNGFHYLPKPVRPASLRALMTKLMLDEKSSQG